MGGRGGGEERGIGEGYSLLGVWCISKHGENKAVRNVKGWGGKEGGRRGQASEGGVGGRGGGGHKRTGASLSSPALKKREGEANK